MSSINISRGQVVPIATAITGTGVISGYFVKKSSPGTLPGEAASFFFGLRNVTGIFTALTINVEFSPTIDAEAYWEVVASWSPMTQPLLTCSSAESGFFRLNVTAFTGGTSFEVWATCAQGGAGGSSGGGGGGTVDQGAAGSSPWPVTISGLSNPLPVSDSTVEGAVSAGKMKVSASAGDVVVEVSDGSNVIGTTTHPVQTALPTATVSTLTPPSAAAIGAACPVPPTAAAIASAIVSNPPTVPAKLQDGAGNNISSDARGSARPLAVEILDASGAQITSFGGSGAVTFANPTTSTLLKAQVNLSTSGDNTVISGVGGQTIRIMKMFLIIGGASEQDITFKDSTPATLLPSSPFTPPASLQLMLDGVPWFITAAGKDFIINLSAAQKVTGIVYYTQS